jgi:hypothetical protein
MIRMELIDATVYHLCAVVLSEWGERLSATGEALRSVFHTIVYHEYAHVSSTLFEMHHSRTKHIVKYGYSAPDLFDSIPARVLRLAVYGAYSVGHTFSQRVLFLFHREIVRCSLAA